MAFGVAPAHAVADRRGRVDPSNLDELDYFTSKSLVADPYPYFDPWRGPPARYALRIPEALRYSMQPMRCKKPKRRHCLTAP
jgi:hypothetical protein